MTADKDSTLQAINDARALLDMLLASDWQEMHVVTGDTEIFLACKGGGANPMRSTPPAAQAMPVAAPAPAASAPEAAVKAPHVATLVNALPVGTTVTAGQPVATLRVLDEQEVVEAPVSGRIIRIHAADGALLEYGTALLSIAEVA
jgi:biotin carboxyl carrier protein